MIEKMIVGSETMRHCLHRRRSNWFHKRCSFGIYCVDRGEICWSFYNFCRTPCQPASLTRSKSNHGEIWLGRKWTRADRRRRETDTGEMIRLRIFGVFHKHFLWRLLNCSPEREEGKKNTHHGQTHCEVRSFPPQFPLKYIYYIYIYRTVHTKDVSTKCSLYNVHVTWKETFMSYIYAQPWNFDLGVGSREMAGSAGIRHSWRKWYFSRKRAERDVFITGSLLYP